MKSSFSPRKNKKNKNIDINRTLKKKNIFNRSQINNKSLLEDIGGYKEQNEISILSNANLNIIQKLINCANEDILNETCFEKINNNDEQKEKSIVSLTKWKKNMCRFKGSPIYRINRNKFQNNKNNFMLNSNISDFSSETISSDIKNESIKPQNQIKKIGLNKIKAKDKNKMRKKILGARYSINEMNLNGFNKKNYEKIIDNVQRANSIEYFDHNYLSKNIDNMKKMPKMNVVKGIEMEKNNNYKDLLSEIETMKINEQMHNNINFIYLKKKINQLKKAIQNKNTKKDSLKYDTKINSPLNKIKIIEELNEKNEQISNILGSNYSNDIQKSEINPSNLKLNLSIKSKKFSNIKDKFRSLIRKKNLYDSIDDEESKDEEIDYYMSPNSWYIKSFDCLLFLSSMIYFIFVPFLLSKNYCILKENLTWKYIFLFIDIIYIIDIFLNFFRAYHNIDENLVSKTKKIFFHYLKTWFLLDFIQAIPYFSIIIFFERYITDNKQYNYNLFGYHNINPRLYLILLVKNIKLYKMFYHNSTLSYIYGILSKNEFFDDHGEFMILFLITLIVLNITTCIFIFLGINSSQSWILTLNIQDKSYLYIYLVSIYFIIVTITTVGYGDITCRTFPEILFQIYLLIIGTITYSYAISYISNHIIKSNKKSMIFQRNLEILQEIKIHHPNMKTCLYNEVLRNLYNEQLYERKDKHLLFDGLPYSLKNKLITEMYKSIIKNFVFFKNIDNSGFIVKVVTSLKPLISIKGDIILQEGDYINEIFFVKKGIIGLNICIDLNNPKLSLKKFFGKKGIGRFNVSYAKSNIIVQKKSFSEDNINNLFNKKNINYDTHVSENVDLENIKVIEIREREHFGDALMFLNERCPLIAKVRTKTSELLILRKMEAIEIYSKYPNIWKRINKKSLYNMEQIYLKIKKIVIQLSNKYKINIDDYLNKKKSKTILKASKDINNKEKVAKFEKKFEVEENKEIKKSIIQKKKAKINEFNDNMNNQEINNNLKEKEEKGHDNNTFLKKNSNHKEKILEKNTLFKNTIIEKNVNISNIEDFNKKQNDIKKTKIININIPFIKYKTIKVNKLKEKKSISISKKNDNSKYHSSISPNAILTDNITNNSNLFSTVGSKLYKKSFTKNEKILYNVFTNLRTTKEKSFQLISSYDNINSISNNKYIKDIKLQSKIKKILIDECTISNIIKNNKNSFLALPGNLADQCRSPNSLNIHKNNNFIISELRKFENNSFYKNNKAGKTINKSKTIKNSSKSENDEEYKSDSFNKESKKGKSGKLFSSKFIFDLRNLKTPFMDNSKINQKIFKKKPEKIDKQLNKISKNIKNSSRNINNPEEFYINLFNNILIKESRSLKDDDENNNYSNSLNQISGIKIKDKSIRKSSSEGKNINYLLFEK